MMDHTHLGHDASNLPDDQTWHTEDLKREFDVKGFAMGLCVVRRKSDGVLGSLRFTTGSDHPRIYYGWVEDK